MRKIALLPFLLSVFFWTAPVWAQLNAASTGLEKTGQSAQYATDDSSTNIAIFMGTYIIRPVFSIVAIVSLGLFVYAGILWMTAAGDDKKVGQAKAIMQNVVIGIVILMASYALVNFIITELSPNPVAAPPAG